MRLRIILCLLFVPAVSFGQSADEAKATIKYLQALQQPDGGFLPAAPNPKLDAKPVSSLRATSAAIRALKYLGGDVPNRKKATEFVEDCFDNLLGGYSELPKGKPDVFSSAVGIMAAMELKLPQPLVSEPLRFILTEAKNFEDIRIAAAGLEASNRYSEEYATRWSKEMAKLRHADGSYGKPEGDARMTGSVVALILRIGGKLKDEEKKASLQVLLAGQQADGGFAKPDAKGSDLETTYRVMRAFHLLQEKPKDVEKLKGFVAKCRNADGGYGVAPGQPSNVGGTYYASTITHWLK